MVLLDKLLPKVKEQGGLDFYYVTSQLSVVYKSVLVMFVLFSFIALLLFVYLVVLFVGVTTNDHIKITTKELIC